VGFQVAAKIFVISVFGVDLSVAEHRRQSHSQLTGEHTKNGLAFRALVEVGDFPIGKLKIPTRTLRLRLIEEAECLDVNCVLHRAHLST